MANPTNKQEFADWILRRLGAPLINVEITDQQIEDIIDEAISYYHEWHHEGTQRSWRVVELDTNILAGNNRRPQNITAEYYDPDKKYTIGDRVRATIDKNQGERIWIKYDSEDPSESYEFIENPKGDWYLEPGDSEYVVFDELKHTFQRYDVDTKGDWVDSDGTKVHYDSNRHITVYYDSEVWGPRTDTPRLYRKIDSDIDQLVFAGDSEDNFTRVTDEELWNYASYTYKFNKASGDSDEDIFIVVKDSDNDVEPDILRIKVGLKGDRRAVTITGDSDGYGVSIPTYTILNNLKMVMTIDDPQVNFKTEILDYTVHTQNVSPLGSNRFGFIWPSEIIYDSDEKISNLEAIEWFNELSEGEEFVRTPTGNVADGDVLFSRRVEPYERFRFYEYTPGERYLKLGRTIDREYDFEDLWALEQKVLAEPELNLDYSKTGQIGIPVPDDIYSIVKCFRVPVGSLGTTFGSFNYQLMLNQMGWYQTTIGSNWGFMTDLYIHMQYIEMIEQQLNTQPPIRFNKHKNRLYIDTYWNRIDRTDIDYLFLEVYEITDPETFGSVYSDNWLRRYATSLAKIQWGSNLFKYSGTELPGNIQINGEAIYREGKDERDQLEEQMRQSFIEMDSIILG